jgi:hypothetical protein
MSLQKTRHVLHGQNKPHYYVFLGSVVHHFLSVVDYSTWRPQAILYEDKIMFFCIFLLKLVTFFLFYIMIILLCLDLMHLFV